MCFMARKIGVEWIIHREWKLKKVKNHTKFEKMKSNQTMNCNAQFW